MLDPEKVKIEVNEIKKNRSKWISRTEYINISQKEFESLMSLQFPYLAEHAKTLFTKCCTGDIDDEKIEYMLSMMHKIITGSKTEHDASVKIGQKLVDEYVIPLIKDKK